MTMTTAAIAMPVPVCKLKEKVTIEMCVIKRGTYTMHSIYHASVQNGKMDCYNNSI